MLIYIKKNFLKFEEESDVNQNLYKCAKCLNIILPRCIIYRGWDYSFCSEECRAKF